MFVAAALTPKKDNVIDDLTNVMNQMQSSQSDLFGDQLQRSIKIDEDADKNSEQLDYSQYPAHPSYAIFSQSTQPTQLFGLMDLPVDSITGSLSDSSLLNNLDPILGDIQEDFLAGLDIDYQSMDASFDQPANQMTFDSLIEQGEELLSGIMSEDYTKSSLFEFDENDKNADVSMDDIAMLQIDHQIKKNEFSSKTHEKVMQAENLSNVIRESDFSQDLVSWVVKNYHGGTQEVTLDLHPVDMGKLRLTIEQDASQDLHISIITESPSIQKLFDQNQHMLRQSIEDQGLSFGGFESSLFENSSESQENSKKEYPWLFETSESEKESSEKIIKGFRAQV